MPKVPKTRQFRRHGAVRTAARVLRAGVPIVALTASVAARGAPAKPEASAPDPTAGRTPVGPPDARVWISDRARMRVRGDRPERASLHVAYAPPEDLPDRELRRALATFESNTFPEDAAPRKTIVDQAPEAWMRGLKNPDLPIRWNERTVEYLRYFRDEDKGRRLIRGWVARLGRYEAQTRAILKETGVPEGLVYVAMVESGFTPSAQSRVGAAGLWQFMEPTGRVYGLSKSYWIDDRLAARESTYAAANYLSDLHARFGSWELALAAYNAGYGLVVKSIRQNNTNNFWALCEIENGLPSATCNYVPKIMAAALAGQNPKAFGLEGVRERAVQTVSVNVPPGTRIEDVATALAADEGTLRAMNARYLRGRVPPEGEAWAIRIPRSVHANFEGLDDKLRAAQQEWKVHRMGLGDDLETLAAEYGLTVKALRRLNGVHDSGELSPGVLLVVPAKPLETVDAPPKALVAVPPLKRGAGQKLVFFRVTRASTRPRITKALDLPWSDIVAWNDLDPSARLVDGQWLQVLLPEAFDFGAAGVRVYQPDEVRHVVRGTRAHLDELLADREMVRRAYKVKSGETLARIAKRFGLSLGSLARINGVVRGHAPKPGDTLIVYVAKNKTGGTTKAPPPSPTAINREAIALETELEAADTRGHRAPSTADTARVPGKKTKRK